MTIQQHETKGFGHPMSKGAGSLDGAGTWDLLEIKADSLAELEEHTATLKKSHWHIWISSGRNDIEQTAVMYKPSGANAAWVDDKQCGFTYELTKLQRCESLLQADPTMFAQWIGFTELKHKYKNDPNNPAVSSFIADLYKAYPIDIDDAYIDMDRAVKQGRVYAYIEPSVMPYAVAADWYAAEGVAVPSHFQSDGGPMWTVNRLGEKHEFSFPEPVHVSRSALRPLTEAERADLIKTNEISMLKGSVICGNLDSKETISVNANFDLKFRRLVNVDAATASLDQVSPLSIAAIAAKHFGNPIPKAAYAFARDLLAVSPASQKEFPFNPMKERNPVTDHKYETFLFVDDSKTHAPISIDPVTQCERAKVGALKQFDEIEPSIQP